MTIWNLGSVNADQVYRLPHLPGPGETLAATEFLRGLGGKGANMSVAAVRAGSHVKHIGAVGADGQWMRDRLADYGVDIGQLAVVDGASGHAIIALDQGGENLIIIHPGANIRIDSAGFETVLRDMAPGDLAICQNETNAQADFLRMARARGLRVAYAAAPFSVDAVRAVIDHVDLLVMNAVEAEQLEAAMQTTVADLPVADVVITLGSKGCRWVTAHSDRTFPAPKVAVVDTTGAGDTFTGYLLAGLDQGRDMAAAIALAQQAAAVKVTRLGTADVIPTRDEVAAAFPAG